MLYFPDFYPIITYDMTHINQLFVLGHHLIINEKIIATCEKLKSDPQRRHALIHGLCDHTTLHNKRDFAQVINLRIGKREDFPGLDE